MAHRHRRTLPTPDPKPSTTTTAATASSTSHKLVRRPHRPTHQPPPPPAVNIDSHFQAKALSASATFDSSLAKPNRQLRAPPNLEKETSRTAKFKDKELKVDPALGGLHSNMRKLSVSLDVGGGGRRRSMGGGGGAQVEVADFLAKNGAKIVSVDMPPFMQIHAVDVARKTRDSLEKFTARTLASALKKEFDGVYGPAWHCIVGTSFGSFVTHSVGGFLYFSLDQNMYVLLFKTTVQKAD